MSYKPEGSAFQRKMEEESLSAWPPGANHQGLALDGSQDDLKCVNSMDGEKLFSVVQGDRRSGRNESQNTDD